MAAFVAHGTGLASVPLLETLKTIQVATAYNRSKYTQTSDLGNLQACVGPLQRRRRFGISFERGFENYKESKISCTTIIPSCVLSC
jgi:hypothetical protein